jgi:hypothetical protein
MRNQLRVRKRNIVSQREPGASDGRTEDSHHSGAGGDVIVTKKGKCRKDKKSAKHRKKKRTLHYPLFFLITHTVDTAL